MLLYVLFASFLITTGASDTPSMQEHLTASQEHLIRHNESDGLLITTGASDTPSERHNESDGPLTTPEESEPSENITEYDGPLTTPEQSEPSENVTEYNGSLTTAEESEPSESDTEYEYDDTYNSDGYDFDITQSSCNVPDIAHGDSRLECTFYPTGPVCNHTCADGHIHEDGSKVREMNCVGREWIPEFKHCRRSLSFLRPVLHGISDNEYDDASENKISSIGEKMKPHHSHRLN